MSASITWDDFEWARSEFGGAKLGNIQLSRRLVDVAARIRANPCGTLPQAFEDSKDLKGAYRMLGHPDITHANILETHIGKTRTACEAPRQYLMIEDTTALSFTQREAVKGLGPLTHPYSQGMLVHTCLAVSIEQWKAHEPEPEQPAATPSKVPR